MNQDQAISFIDSLAAENYCPEEYADFLAYYRQASRQQKEELLNAFWEAMEKYPSDWTYVQPGFADRFIERMKTQEAEQKIAHALRRGRILRIARISAAAVTITAILGIGVWRLLRKKPETVPAADRVFALRSRIHPDKYPLLTLEDGRTLVLDSNASPRTYQLGTLTLNYSKEYGLRYQSAHAEQGAHLIQVPAGQLLHIRLPDSSNIWLNAGSDLCLDLSGKGSDPLSGEAYFEINHSVQRTFRVTAGNHEIADMGTKFDVNAYSEKNLRVAVLSGAVNVQVADTELIALKEGQSLQFKTPTPASPKHYRVRSVDEQESVSWVTGSFYFPSGMDLETAMDRLTHWYGVGVKYEQEDLRKAPFGVGYIGQDLTLTELLEILNKDKSNGITFQLYKGVIVIRRS